MAREYWAVDRIESTVAVLERDDGQSVDVPRTMLPNGVREGTVLLVETTSAGEPDWRSAVVDDEERRRRVKEVKEMLEELKKRDPGGDVDLT